MDDDEFTNIVDARLRQGLERAQRAANHIQKLDEIDKEFKREIQKIDAKIRIALAGLIALVVITIIFLMTPFLFL